MTAGGNVGERTPCANRVGALEQTIRSYAETSGDHVLEPSLGMKFDSFGEAYDFYNLKDKLTTRSLLGI